MRRSVLSGPHVKPSNRGLREAWKGVTNMRALRKKALALLSAATLLCMAVAPQLTLPALAAGEYFELPENNANLFINVDQEIELQDVSVVVNGQAVNGKDVEWTCTDNDNVSIANGIMKVSSKGIFSLEVADKNGHTANVNVVTKLKDESEFVLYEEDFADIADGSLPEGWTVVKNDDVTDDPSLQHDTYVATPQVVNGKFVMGNGVVNDKWSYVLLPEFLDDFADYTVDMDFAQTYTAMNVYFYCGLLVRAGRQTAGDVTTLTGGCLSQAWRAAKDNSGLRISNLSTASKVVGPYSNNLGADRDFGATTNWKAAAYDMHMSTSVRGSDVKMDLYRLPDQPHFDGDPFNTCSGYKEDVASPVLQADIGSWNDVPAYGGVGLAAVTSQMTVDAIKVSVPVSMLASNPNYYVPSSEQGGEDEVYDDLKFGVISDLHIHADMETGVDTNLVTMLTKYKNENVDVILITGDVATTGLKEEYDKFLAIWDSVFPDPGAAPVRLALTGNHEFEQAIFGREEVQDVYDKYMAAYGYDTVNQHIKVNGYHFIGLNSEDSPVNGKYTAATADWLREQLDAAVAENPYRPIFVACHEPLPNTTYGSGWGATATQALYDVLKDYPQVVYFAGHSHRPSENERSIYQNLFTAIDVTSMQYVSVEPDVTPSGAYSAQGGLLVTVEGVNKQIVVDRYRIDGDSVKKIKNPWKLSLPLKKSTFAYTEARKDERSAPTFADGAAVQVSDLTVNSLKITFPSASHDDYVQGYTVYIKEKGSGNVVTSKYFVSDFWLDMDNMAAEQSTSISGLLPNMDYIVEVTAVESFGLESDPLTADFTTLPVTTPAPSINRADMLDVDFMKGFEDNSPYRLAYELYGSGNQSKIVASEELGRNVLSANGWINYAITAGMLDKITNSVTMEVAFMLPGEVPKSQCLFGNPESGGMTIEFTNTGKLQVGAHIAGGWKFVQVPGIEADTWYHLVVTFDGENVKAYLNGALVGTTAAVGTIKHNKAITWLTVGANVTKDGNATSKFIGEMALARVYTQALSAEEAAATYTFFNNDPQYQTIYDKMLVLKALLDEDLTDEQTSKANALIARAEELIVDAGMTEAEATAFIDEATALIDEASASNPSVNWKTFQDPCSDFSLMHDRSANWQKDKNADINKQFLSKTENEDEYLIWKVDGYIRSFDFAALQYGDFGNVKKEVTAYVSEDGQTWRELNVSATTPVPDPNYAPGVAVAWLDSTVSPKIDVGGEFQYLKIVVKAFDSGVKWSVCADDVLIKYSDKADDIPLAPGTFADEVSYDFTDDLTNLDKVSSKSDNWESFPNHSETGLSVIGKTDAARGWVSYKLDGQAYTDLQVNVQAGVGFFPLTDLEVEARAAGSEAWTPVTMKLNGTTPVNDKFEVQSLIPAAGLPENTEEIRISLVNGIAWTAMLDSISMNIGNLVSDTEFVDEMEDLTKASSESGNWRVYNPHPESGLSVIGRLGLDFDTSLTYKFEGKAITGAKFQIQYAPDYIDINRDMKVLVRKAGSNEWTEMTLALSAPSTIPGYEDGAFRTAEVTLTEAIPADTAEIKVQLVNDALWTLFLDRVSLELAASSVDDNPGDNPGGGDEEKTYNFTDEMESFDSIHDRSDNWELFNPHPETDLSVIGKTNGKRGYITYMRSGSTIGDFAVNLQMAPLFFNKDSHLLVQVRLAGSDEWTPIEVNCAAPVKINGSFSTTLVTPVEALPAGVEEVRIYLYNDVAYTLMVDRVMIDYVSASTDPGSDPTDNPQTGASAAIPAILLAGTASAAAVLLRKRRRTEKES